MDRASYTKSVDAAIVILQTIIARGTLMPDQAENAVLAVRELRLLRNSRSDRRLKRFIRKLAQIFVKPEAPRVEV